MAALGGYGCGRAVAICSLGESSGSAHHPQIIAACSVSMEKPPPSSPGGGQGVLVLSPRRIEDRAVNSWLWSGFLSREYLSLPSGINHVCDVHSTCNIG